MLLLLIFLLLINILAGVANQMIDYFGHLGGAIIGFLTGLGLCKSEDNRPRKLLRALSLTGVGVLFTTFLLVLYLHKFTCQAILE